MAKEIKLKQILYKLVYGKKLALVIDYKLYGSIIIKRLLEIIDKVS